MQEWFRTVVIEGVDPEIDSGRYPIKRVVGDELTVEADIFKEGHDLLAAFVRYRQAGETEWRQAPMRFVDNDRWRGCFPLTANTRYCYTIAACPDVARSWLSDLQKKTAAGADVASDLLEGARLLSAAAERAKGADRGALAALAERLAAAPDPEAAIAVVDDPDLLELALRFQDPALITTYDRELQVVVDRPAARFAAWYEIFPRSQGTDSNRSATFREAEASLPRIADMGFDVLYLTPIHPIGHTNRKGPNNTLTAGPNDPGSPYAIGSEAGGHTAIEPALGTLENFDHFHAAARKLGLELALDFAIQVSPDHPWVREHPDWFYRRPDGTIKYAENPPKKYEDIYPLNFYGPCWHEVWHALRDVILFWVARGVKIFRVDNPHTKPLDFWTWLITEVQRDHPDVIFLSEAFTRPKMMKALAKAGFTQSYTYFTWRNEKQELEEYLTELTTPPVCQYFRGNFFTNTPDILPEVLQKGGRPAFAMRLVLAATSSSLYGIYNGFELCENRARPDSEVYQDSEMYQHKTWDWDRPGNIASLVRRVNEIRRQNAALHETANLRIVQSSDPNILCYSKVSRDGKNVVLVTLNLDPYAAHEAIVEFPCGDFGIPSDESFNVRDLLDGQSYTWQGTENFVRLDPAVRPAHVFRIERLW